MPCCNAKCNAEGLSEARESWLVYNVMFSNPLLKGCPKAHWSKSLKPPGWVRTDKAWVTPVHGEGTSKKEQEIMPWKPLSGCQSRLMAMRYLTVVAELTDNDANKLLKEENVYRYF